MKTILAKRITTLAALLAASWLLCGCATVSERTHAYLGSPQLSPTTPGAVRIFASEPNRAKVRLGEVVLSIDGNPPRQRIEEKLRTGAARLGANGIFVVSDRTHIYPIQYWDWWGPAGYSEDWQRVVVGVAFKYK